MPVAGLTKVSSEGLNRSCGLDTEGTVWCWGLHGRGKVQRITAPLPFSDVEVTASHTCAIGEDASVWCWGNNVRGQLGSGEPRCARTPIDFTAEILQALEATEDSP
jgi:alpha-tubulin suppressor-like RCC1 family protein